MVAEMPLVLQSSFGSEMHLGKAPDSREGNVANGLVVSQVASETPLLLQIRQDKQAILQHHTYLAYCPSEEKAYAGCGSPRS